MKIPSQNICAKALDLFTKYRELGLGIRDDRYTPSAAIFTESFSTTEKLLAGDLDFLVRGALGPSVRKLAEQVATKAKFSTDRSDLSADDRTVTVSNRLAMLGCKIEESGNGYQVSLSIAARSVV